MGTDDLSVFVSTFQAPPISYCIVNVLFLYINIVIKTFVLSSAMQFGPENTTSQIVPFHKRPNEKPDLEPFCENQAVSNPRKTGFKAFIRKILLFLQWKFLKEGLIEQECLHESK